MAACSSFLIVVVGVKAKQRPPGPRCIARTHDMLCCSCSRSRSCRSCSPKSQKYETELKGKEKGIVPPPAPLAG